MIVDGGVDKDYIQENTGAVMICGAKKRKAGNVNRGKLWLNLPVEPCSSRDNCNIIDWGPIKRLHL